MAGFSVSPVQAGIFLVYHHVQTGYRPHPAFYAVGTPGALSLRVKWTERETGYSTPSKANV
jgi:hypothetical protein